MITVTLIRIEMVNNIAIVCLIRPFCPVCCYNNDRKQDVSSFLGHVELLTTLPTGIKWQYIHNEIDAFKNCL